MGVLAAGVFEHQYTVVCQRSGPAKPGFHKLKVQAFRLDDDVRKDFKARTRDGWWIGKAAP